MEHNFAVYSSLLKTVKQFQDELALALVQANREPNLNYFDFWVKQAFEKLMLARDPMNARTPSADKPS